jgi:small subunit ribosomal protein S20
MANTKSAAKRARQTVTISKANRRVLTAVKKEIKGIRATIKSGAKAAAQEASKAFASTVDKAAKTGRIHANKANRLKSRAAKQIAKLS